MTKLKLHPRECEDLLGAAQHDINRSLQEELDIRQHWNYPEVWEFTRAVGDYESPRFEAVCANLARGVRYLYYVNKDSGFWLLRKRLLYAGCKEQDLLKLLECIILPPELFQTNFTIFAPCQHGEYLFGHGAKVEFGISYAYFNLDSSETFRLYGLLREWRELLMAGVGPHFVSFLSSSPHIIFPERKEEDNKL